MDGSNGIIIKNTTDVLLVKRRDMPLWVIPGGRIEAGESPEQAVVREVFEETGFKVEISKKIGEYYYKSSGKITHTFLCNIVGGIATLSNESKEIKYFNLNKLPAALTPFQKQMIFDATLDDSLIKHTFTKLPLSFWLKALLHPWGLFKYTLTRFGIHWNT